MSVTISVITAEEASNIRRKSNTERFTWMIWNPEIKHWEEALWFEEEQEVCPFLRYFTGGYGKVSCRRAIFPDEKVLVIRKN